MLSGSLCVNSVVAFANFIASLRSSIFKAIGDILAMTSLLSRLNGWKYSLLHHMFMIGENSHSGCFEYRSVMMFMKLAFRCSGSVANHRATASVITVASVTLGKKVTSSPDDHPRTLVNILKSLL